MSRALLPGSVIGVLGAGQLGRMMAISARQLGYRVAVYSPDAGAPAAPVADREWVAAYDDFDALAEFASQVDVVTLEFENIPTATVEYLDRSVPVRPGVQVLQTAQNRLREKVQLQRMGLPVAPFRLVRSARELAAAVTDFGGSCIVKTTQSGYDGKGQQRVHSPEHADEVWPLYADHEVVSEQVIDFSREFSVIGVRGTNGDIRCFDPIGNSHQHHILDVSVSPADEITPLVRKDAIDMTRTVMQELDAVGVLCVEFFLTTDGQPIINEIAPRPHNSGHLTIDAHLVSQFEQQVRAVCGLPLGSTEQRQPAAMANLLGDLWKGDVIPDWERLLELPNVKLHLYGKSRAVPGRKMGHITALSSRAAAAEQIVRQARGALTMSSVADEGDELAPPALGVHRSAD